MSKKLSITLGLENGKNLTFSIANIKEIETAQASEYIKAFNFDKVIAKNDIKAKKVEKAEIVSTVHEEINLA